LQNHDHDEAMNTKKVTRREALKTMAAAAAVLVAVPHLGKLPTSITSSEGTSKEVQQTSNLSSGDEPFVVVVGKDGVKGFRGFAEFTLNDSGLKQSILNAFSGAGAQ
jgi:hypothetical protein